MYLCLHAQGSYKWKVYGPVVSNSPWQSENQVCTCVCAHAQVCVYMCMWGWGWSMFSNRVCKQVQITKADHTSIWKLYFLTWAIFWKIDSDVWNWFRTVVRNVQYKWKKLVFNVFPSQLFLPNKYASWGVRELVGQIWNEGGSSPEL